MTTAGNSSTRTTSSNTSSTTNPPETVGSNSLQLSKFQRPDAEQSIVSHSQFPGTSRNRDLDLESNWLCSHYKRVRYVNASTESIDPLASKDVPNSFPNPKTSTESPDALASKDVPNSFPNPKTSTESPDPLTSKDVPNSFPNPKTSTESPDPLTSKDVPNSLSNPQTSTESTEPLISKDVPSSFPNPKTSTESPDPLTSKDVPNSFPNPKTSTESTDPPTLNGAARSFSNPSTESTNSVTSNDATNSLSNPQTSTESTDPLTSKGATNSFPNPQTSTESTDPPNPQTYIERTDPPTAAVSGEQPVQSVARTLYNNYKLLLLSLARRLLSPEVVKLKDWAVRKFSIENPQNATDVLFRLDQKGIIHASDLGQLRDFFEYIVRFDLVHIIDAFLLGDYSLLRQTPRRTRTITQQRTTTSSRIPTVAPNEINNAQLPSQPRSVNENQAREVASLRSSHNSDNEASPSRLSGQSTGEVSIIK